MDIRRGFKWFHARGADINQESRRYNRVFVHADVRQSLHPKSLEPTHLARIGVKNKLGHERDRDCAAVTLTLTMAVTKTMTKTVTEIVTLKVTVSRW
jgi:hypothetical protein